jgi:ABC-type lipoprotein export system ATPase subunit
MSGGEQQRVAIARSLINEPTLVLGDEPMGEVDTDTANALLGLMRRINVERAVSFVIVTHDLDLAARTDRIIRLRDGRLASDERTSTGIRQTPPGMVAPEPGDGARHDAPSRETTKVAVPSLR